MNLCVIVICGVISLIRTDKIDDAVFKDYGGFFNFGDKKVKLDERKPQLKPKLEVLGAVFKENIDSIKSSNKKLDLVFLIDSSSSIGEKNFQNEIKFVRKLLSDVVVDYNHARVAIVTFSSAKNVSVVGEPIRQAAASFDGEVLADPRKKKNLEEEEKNDLHQNIKKRYEEGQGEEVQDT